MPIGLVSQSGCPVVWLFPARYGRKEQRNGALPVASQLKAYWLTLYFIETYWVTAVSNPM